MPQYTAMCDGDETKVVEFDEPETVIREALRADPENVLSLCTVGEEDMVPPGDPYRGRSERVLVSVQRTLADLVPATESGAEPLHRCSARLTRVAVAQLKVLPSVLSRCAACPMRSMDDTLDELEMLLRRLTEYSGRVVELRQHLSGRLDELRAQSAAVDLDCPVPPAEEVSGVRLPTLPSPGSEPVTVDAKWGYLRRLRTDVDADWGSALFDRQQRHVEQLKRRAALIEPLFEQCCDCVEDVASLAALPAWFVDAVGQLKGESDTKVAAYKAGLQQLKEHCAADHGALMDAVNRTERVLRAEHLGYEEWHKACDEWFRRNLAQQAEKERELDELPGKFVNEEANLKARLAELKKEKEAEIERALRQSQEFLEENEARQRETEERLATLLQSQEEQRLLLVGHLEELRGERGRRRERFESDAATRKRGFDTMRALLGAARRDAFLRCDELEHTQRCTMIAADLANFVRDVFAGCSRAGERDVAGAPAEEQAWLARVHTRIVDVGTEMLLAYARAMHLRELQCEDLNRTADSTTQSMEFCIETGDPAVAQHHTWLSSVKAQMAACDDDETELAGAIRDLLGRLRESEAVLAEQGVAVRAPAEALRAAVSGWEGESRRLRAGAPEEMYPGTGAPRTRSHRRGVVIAAAASSDLSATWASAGPLLETVDSVAPPVSPAARAPAPGLLGASSGSPPPAPGPPPDPLTPAAPAEPPPPPGRELRHALIGSSTSMRGSPLKPQRLLRPTPPPKRVAALAASTER